MPRGHSRRQQSERDGHRQIDVVADRDELRLCYRIELRNRGFVTRIDFANVGVLINDLRFVIAEPIELVRDLVEILLPNNYSNQFFTADPKSIALDHLCRPFRIREWIE